MGPPFQRESPSWQGRIGIRWLGQEVPTASVVSKYVELTLGILAAGGVTAHQCSWQHC